MRNENEPSKVEAKGDSPDTDDKKHGDKKPTEVEIEVNNKTVKLLSGNHSGAEINRKAMEQGGSVKEDFILTLLSDNEEKVPNQEFAPSDIITIQGHEKFNSTSPDYGS